jgi:hypothetical protein
MPLSKQMSETGQEVMMQLRDEMDWNSLKIGQILRECELINVTDRDSELH